MADHSITDSAASFIDAVKLIVTTPKMLGVLAASLFTSISATWAVVYFLFKNQLATRDSTIDAVRAQLDRVRNDTEAVQKQMDLINRQLQSELALARQETSSAKQEAESARQATELEKSRRLWAEDRYNSEKALHDALKRELETETATADLPKKPFKLRSGKLTKNGLVFDFDLDPATKGLIADLYKGRTFHTIYDPLNPDEWTKPPSTDEVRKLAALASLSASGVAMVSRSDEGYTANLVPGIDLSDHV